MDRVCIVCGKKYKTNLNSVTCKRWECRLNAESNKLKEKDSFKYIKSKSILKKKEDNNANISTFS